MRMYSSEKRDFFIVEEHIGLPIAGNVVLRELGVDSKSTIERLTYNNNNEIEDDDVYSITQDNLNVSLDVKLQEKLNRGKVGGMPINCGKNYVL